MLVTQKRPRDLHWYHAGPLLFGDWGTSRLYVLGLAFYYSGHASVFYMAAIGVLMMAVAWAYTVVCRCFPDGGGVYAAAKQVNPALAVIGSTLLMCGYIITVVISLVEAFHYIGFGGASLVLGLSLLALGGLGVVNWLGSRSAGTFAAITAFLALGATLILGVLCLPYVPAGLRTGAWHTGASTADPWIMFPPPCLAMAGGEGAAKLAGLMKEPVARTAKRTIWPVAFEVATLNILFALALAGLAGFASLHQPDYVTFEAAGRAIPEHVRAYRDTGMKVLAVESAQHWFGERGGHLVGVGVAIAFGLLLISAANTAVMAMVSVLYSLGHDRELPRALTRLNYPGVPWIALIVSCVACALVLLLERDVARLADMYVIGVSGAVTTNILSCAANRSLGVTRPERAGLWALGLFLLAIALTIAVTKPQATAFAGATIATVLLTRGVLRMHARAKARELPVPVPEQGWLAELKREPRPVDPSRPRIMLAARGRGQAEFAVDLARRRGATLFVIYVRTLRVMDLAPGSVPRVEDDPQALEALGSVVALARRYRVPVQPIYVCATDVVAEILDYTVTFGCDTLIMGKTRRRAFARALEGDVVTQIAQHLPSEVALITRDSSPHPMGPEPAAEVVKPAGVEGAPPGDGPGAEGGND